MIDLTHYKAHLDGKPIAVFGLGKSGMAAIALFQKYNIDFDCWDDNQERIDKAKDMGASCKALQEIDLSSYACLLLAPGVPLHHPEPHPVVKKAQEAGIEIICDIELFYRACCLNVEKADFPAHQFIGITGTNGKSTTTALIGHVLNICDTPVAVGGNIGTPILSMDLPQSKGWIVLEISSFQLDLCIDFKPDIGVLINLVPDHLDRHKDMDGYMKAKLRLFQNGCPAAVIGVDDKYSKDILDYLEDENSGIERLIPVSYKTEIPKGVYVDDSSLIDAAFEGEKTTIKPYSELTQLPGDHNRQNINIAYATSRLVGLNPDNISKAVQTFHGLPHRISNIAVINGISYVNDSKATNIDSTKRALASYKKIYWILGGRPKSDGLSGADEFLDRVRHAFLIGEASDEFAKWFDKRGVSYSMCGSLDKAVSEAHEKAQAERGEPGGAGAVLFSPACASFDQYDSFEHRGDHFIDLVSVLMLDSASGQCAAKS